MEETEAAEGAMVVAIKGSKPGINLSSNGDSGSKRVEFINRSRLLKFLSAYLENGLLEEERILSDDIEPENNF